MSDRLDTTWISIFDNGVGLIVIVVSIIAILELAFSFVYALEVLLIGLFVMGVAWVIMGIYVLHAYLYVRIFMLINGFAAIAIVIIDFTFISLPPDYLVLYPTIAMLLIGSSRLVLGYFISEIPFWIRMLQALAGILTINLAVLVFVFPGVAFEGIILLLVIAFIANGLVRLVMGLTETKQRIMESSVDEDISS